MSQAATRYRPPTAEAVRPFVPCDDFELCKRFYVEIGFTQVQEDGRIAIFACGSAGFILQNYRWPGAGENYIHGPAELLDTEDCLIWSEGKTIAAIGLRDLIVVQTEEAVLVLPKSRAQDVKRIVEQLKARGGKSGGGA